MRVLVVKTSSMGDVVHTLASVTDMARAFPDLSVDWLVEAPFASIAAMHPAVHRVIPLSWRKWRKCLWRASTWAAMKACRAELRAQPYDAIIDFQGLLKSVVWGKQARGPLLGYDLRSIREPLASFFYSRVVPVPRQLQAVERSRQLAALHLGYELPASAPDFGLQPPPAGWMPGHYPYVVLIPCASRVEKRWPLAHWQALLTQCASRGLQVVVLWGSKEEQALAEEVVLGSQATVPPFLTVRDAAAVLARAQVVVGLDTGFTHLAAAFGVSTVGIYCDHEPGLAGVTGSGFVRSLGGRGMSPSFDEVKQAFEDVCKSKRSAESC
ncbi:MAG: lipopolysaccharide heptosyltransferase I [Burkholderiales bacterium]